MNFDNMPELRTKWGYFVVMLCMAVLASGMLVFFYRKGWLSSLDARRKRAPLQSTDHPLVDLPRHPLTQPTPNGAGPHQGTISPPPPRVEPPRLPGSRPAMSPAATRPAAPHQ
jgi:hypothetical protein